MMSLRLTNATFFAGRSEMFEVCDENFFSNYEGSIFFIEKIISPKYTLNMVLPNM